MLRLLFLLSQRMYNTSSLLRSQLLNEQTFYDAFMRDIRRAQKSIIIESPFITTKRLEWLYDELAKACSRGVRIVINTRDPNTHNDTMHLQARDGVIRLQDLGVTILYTGNHHRKLAIIDHRTLYEGSLNILSQTDSCEIMRRIESPELVQQMIRFTDLARWYN